MQTHMTMRFVYWTPRVMSLLFAGFISVFALDVFGGGYGFGETLLALAIHLIPTGILLLVALLAWRWPWVGALAYLGIGCWYVLMTWGEAHWLTYLILVGPLVVISILYARNWCWWATLQN